MGDGPPPVPAARQALHACSLGFWRAPRIRRILELAGWDVRAGRPGPDGHVAVWGASPAAWRGRAMAARTGARLVTVEDAFLRSVVPGRAPGHLARRGPIGLLIDDRGLHFDPARPSIIERLVCDGATTGHERRARQGIARLRAADLSKYNTHRPGLRPPEQGYVLVIDQVRGDASLMGAGGDRFRAMLAAARAEHPGCRVVVRTHPETGAGLRPGHLTAADLRPGEVMADVEISPWAMLAGARAVYAVSSQMGYESILAGHRPRLFGQPFYAGWDLSDDDRPLPPGRRGRAAAETLFAASHLLAPVWFDPCRDRLTDFDGAVDQIEAEAKAFRQDRDGHLAHGIRLWKRPGIARTFGNGRGVRFARRPGPDVTLTWASRGDPLPGALRVEDGFLRSRGLGANLVPALSLVADDLGIYYDPTRESRLERLVAEGPPPGGRERALRLIAAINGAGLSKYNLAGPVPAAPLPGRTRILVPGQVADDASIRLGSGAETGSLTLLQRVRRDNPEAWITFKPHPDVEAGLRPGAIPDDAVLALADRIARTSDPAALLAQVDEVWTISSTLGFEALLRGVPVTVLGAPFYAGWGLTQDKGPVPARRQARPDLAAFVHACLVAYPRYVDPVTGLPCPPEVAVDRLRDGAGPRPPVLRLLARLQGALAGQAWLWRR